MSNDNVVDDLEQLLSTHAQEPPVKGIIERLNDADVEALKQISDATYAKRLEPRQAAERHNKEYRDRVALMSRTEFEQEKAKLPR
jgi:hypothetical protein